jgi:glycosyltransferase involved in cell wall biosynthesis
LHDILTLKLPAKIASSVVVTSSSEFDDAKKYGIRHNKIRIVPLTFVRPEASYRSESDGNIKRKLLFVGRIVPNKHLETVIYALKEAQKQMDNIVLQIVGDEISGRMMGDEGYKNQITKLIKSLDLDDKVELLGWHTGQTLWKLYSDADILLCSSTYENFCLPILEAAAFGKPVVSTDVGCARDIIGDNQGGFIINNNDPNAMTIAILELLVDKERYKKASAFLLHQINNFSVIKVADMYEKIYDEALKNH